MTADLSTAAQRARASLDRVGQHIQAGALEPTPAQYIELWELVASLALAVEPEELMDVLARVDEFVRRVCPQVRGEGN